MVVATILDLDITTVSVSLIHRHGFQLCRFHVQNLAIRIFRFLSGTDDFMVKPVNVNEMVLRVGALLRRAQMINERRQTVGSTVMECDSLTVTTPKESMVLPQKEFMLLYKMASFPGRIFTRQQLMDDIWGYESSSETHTVDVHIGRLREKFRDNPDFEIVTIRGIGYKVVKK